MSEAGKKENDIWPIGRLDVRPSVRALSGRRARACREEERGETQCALGVRRVTNSAVTRSSARSACASCQILSRALGPFLLSFRENPAGEFDRSVGKVGQVRARVSRVAPNLVGSSKGSRRGSRAKVSSNFEKTEVGARGKPDIGVDRE
ncbi:hypothetical protein KM043_005071 [Ampulex compressa]|nr:hypothetical protein KM043_005071 [Ampulex compressa]